jgi:glyoxylase-like metal-dependent hydrolase (beta-lactamase superfamily II)
MRSDAQAAVIDRGWQIGPAHLAEAKLTVTQIINTHGHSITSGRGA